VIIRGLGFPSSGLTVDFGGTAAAAFTRISDTEIHATYSPISTAGTYAVNVGDGVTSLSTRANLVVVDPPAFASATIPRQNNPGGVGNLIYDAQRRALYLMDADRVRLEAFRYVDMSGSWVQDATTVGGGPCLNCRIALSPDGREILMTSGLTMLRIDPATLAQNTPVSAFPFLGSGGSLNLIAFGNDGGAVGSANSPATGISLYRYDMLSQTFSALSTRPDLTNRTIVASGDGDTLVLPTFESVVAGFEKPLFTYDASAGTLTQRSLMTRHTNHASLSRDGSRIILTNAESDADQTTTVYNSAFVPLGALPASARPFVISPDGAKVYVYDPTTGTIRKFDLNTPGGFTETASVAVATPGDLYGRMTISPDGGTLFLARSADLLVVPAP
jgi:DNA-binding beta-propeller fold protein YncE